MKKIRLGTTGIEVPAIGLGSSRIKDLSVNEEERLISGVQIRNIQNQIEEALSRHNNELTIRLACPPSLSGNLYHILPLRKL